jgi:hypothetical protein
MAMFRHLHMLRRLTAGCLFATALVSGTAFAQASKSAPLAQELAKLLDAGKLDTIAAQGREPDRFFAALYFPGQLLVVSAKYSVPPLLVEKLQQKAYRDVYMDLHGASVPETKVFILDIGADGLKAKADGGADSYERGTKTAWSFNGEWRKQKIASEDEYLKNYAVADAEYAEILTALIQKAK